MSPKRVQDLPRFCRMHENTCAIEKVFNSAAAWGQIFFETKRKEKELNFGSAIIDRKKELVYNKRKKIRKQKC